MSAMRTLAPHYAMKRSMICHLERLTKHHGEHLCQVAHVAHTLLEDNLHGWRHFHMLMMAGHHIVPCWCCRVRQWRAPLNEAWGHHTDEARTHSSEAATIWACHHGTGMHWRALRKHRQRASEDLLVQVLEGTLSCNPRTWHLRRRGRRRRCRRRGR